MQVISVTGMSLMMRSPRLIPCPRPWLVPDARLLYSGALTPFDSSFLQVKIWVGDVSNHPLVFTYSSYYMNYGKCHYSCSSRQVSSLSPDLGEDRESSPRGLVSCLWSSFTPRKKSCSTPGAFPIFPRARLDPTGLAPSGEKPGRVVTWLSGSA